ncbi:MAG: Holliday junction branch migration protein RuvA [Deltaproteobacteria bacterium]
MIEHLRGRLAGGGKDFVVVECAGMGFRVQVSSGTRGDLPSDGQECFLHTWLQIREGGSDLFGFSTETERQTFLAIIGVSGVGPKSAIAVLSTLGISGVLSACAREDAAPFTRVPGIGKKLAQRIAMELPDRLKKVAIECAPVPGGEGEAVPSAPETEAVQALASLGFSRAEAQLAMSNARKTAGADASTADLLREALKRLSGPRR